MIYKFKLVSDEVDHFSREIEIDANDNFDSLRKAILQSVGYPENELTDFYICTEDWQKGTEIMQMAMDTDSDTDCYLMSETAVEDMIEEKGDRLMFVFDFITERAFFMELREIQTGRHLDAPVCVSSVGTPPPQQVDLNEFDEQLDTLFSGLDIDSETGEISDDILDNLDIQNIDDLDI